MTKSSFPFGGNVFFLWSYCSGVVNEGETNAAAFTACHLYFHKIYILYSKQVCIQKIETRMSSSPTFFFSNFILGLS